ncbi:hypothetical protein HELRODRAFT_135759, partial [Helobdella robusta]|uniref:protein-tyrosine-phosphatase n=1 Tax=Helobdella robusta TaxID=6412 RepID=T1EIA4_HELRO
QNLIGDFSRKYLLPLVSGRHQDLKSISISTMASLLKDEFKHVIDSYTIVDCRYPYEFNGGHIKVSSCSSLFLPLSFSSSIFVFSLSHLNCRSIIIFHCEFSSERGPKLSRLLRKKDRELNEYPKLNYPELYLLEGGYKAFFSTHPDLCEPKGYIPMTDPSHVSELKYFRNKSSS